jgi:ligand-binding sensor domain-containing protein
MMARTVGIGKQVRHLLALGSVLAVCRCIFALDPSLDVSQYAHTSWKTREGFTKGTIWVIAQTPDGYLWLGTEFGLVRFDGVRTVPLQPPPDQHLSSSSITALLAARDGTLWIGMRKGLRVGRMGSSRTTPSLMGKMLTGFSRIETGRCGSVGSDFQTGGCARSRMEASGVTDRTAFSGPEWSVCLRTARAIFGQE